LRKIALDPIFLEMPVNVDKISQDRSFIIDAFLCRLFKSRRQLSLAEITTEAVRQITMFSPSVRDLKHSIDTLIDREILERDKDDFNKLNYIP
jgi:hypothetical protein